MWNRYLALYLFVILLFGLSRVKEEYRWGAWAPGEAQNLNAATHFAEEGFKKHYFLPYYHPGHLGERYGTENKLGYYTHYPPLSAILNGLVIKIFGPEPWKNRMMSVFLSTAWLLFFYLLIKRLLNQSLAFISVFFIGISVGFLDYMDGLSPYTYSEFFVYGGLLFYVLGDQEPKKATLKTLSAWILFFLESFNSFDYILFIPLFILGYHLLLRKNFKQNVLKISIFLLAPLAGFILHLLQNAWLLHGLKNAYQDLSNIASARLAQPFSINKLWLDFSKLTLNMLGWLKMNYGLRWPQLFILVLIFSYLTQVKNTLQNIQQLYKTLFVFLISTLVWWHLGMQAAWNFAQTMVRQIYPFISIILAFTILEGLNLIRRERRMTFKIAFVVGLLIINIKSISHTITYLGEYPNWIRPIRCWTIKSPQSTLIETIELSKELKKHTNYGDIIFVPEQFIWLQGNKQPNPIYEYYAQRRMEYIGNELPEFIQRKTKIENYLNKELPIILGYKSSARQFILYPTFSNNIFYSELPIVKSSKKVTQLNQNFSLAEL
ncbi:MAG: glycosyltransferase family 39 protein [Elusimicrobia bacterium]|nr:glycosyltransferase family 39 protein [Elusimicrobiota bacterium]